MGDAYEPEVVDLAAQALTAVIRRHAIVVLQGDLTAHNCRQVQRWMRMAEALSGSGTIGTPRVLIHGIPDGPSQPSLVPQILSVSLPDLVAARASDHIAAALEGDAEARKAVELVAEQIFRTEDIQIE